jgi:hypothetical protein
VLQVRRQRGTGCFPAQIALRSCPLHWPKIALAPRSLPRRGESRRRQARSCLRTGEHASNELRRRTVEVQAGAGGTRSKNRRSCGGRRSRRGGGAASRACSRSRTSPRLVSSSASRCTFVSEQCTSDTSSTRSSWSFALRL